MNTKIVTFSDIEIGKEFFDPYCGDTFQKVSETQGKCVITGELDDFDPADVVE